MPIITIITYLKINPATDGSVVAEAGILLGVDGITKYLKAYADYEKNILKIR